MSQAVDRSEGHTASNSTLTFNVSEYSLRDHWTVSSTAMTEEQAVLAASILDGMFEEVHAFAVDPGQTLMLGLDEASARCVLDALPGHPIEPHVATGGLVEIFDEWLAES